ncbi:MAG: TIGR02996 domain-containing protein [Polyangiaceae bacterium]
MREELKVSVEDVGSAVAAADWSRALDIALACWTETRSPAIAEAIERISARALGSFTPPTAKGLDAFHTSWLEIADQSMDRVSTAWLAQTFTRHAAGLNKRDGLETKQWLARLERLRRRCPDPRIGAALAELLLKELTRMSSSGVLAEPLLELFVTAGDARHAAALSAAAMGPGQKLRVRRAELLEGLPTALKRLPLSKEVTETERALWAKIAPVAASEEPTRPRGQDADSTAQDLLARIYEAPDDDELRTVFADRLLEEGDNARAELIIQQLRNPKPAKLTPKQKRQWLGEDLARVLPRVSFARGFLHSGSFGKASDADEQTWERAMNDDRLGTAAFLDRWELNAELFGKFIASPRLCNLRRVIFPTNASFEPILASPLHRRIERLELEFLPNRSLVRQLAEAPAMANVRCLSFRRRPSLNRTQPSPPPAVVDALFNDLLSCGWLNRVSQLDVADSSMLINDWESLPSSIKTISAGKVLLRG